MQRKSIIIQLKININISHAFYWFYWSKPRVRRIFHKSSDFLNARLFFAENYYIVVILFGTKWWGIETPIKFEHRWILLILNSFIRPQFVQCTRITYTPVEHSEWRVTKHKKCVWLYQYRETHDVFVKFLLDRIVGIYKRNISDASLQVPGTGRCRLVDARLSDGDQQAKVHLWIVEFTHRQWLICDSSSTEMSFRCGQVLSRQCPFVACVCQCQCSCRFVFFMFISLRYWHLCF